MKKLASIGCLLLLFAVSLGVYLFVVPPWESRTASTLHQWLWNVTGFSLHSIDDYTGTAKSWDSEGNLRQEYGLRDGLRHGTWIEYDEEGAITNKSEYRDGDPWDGICYVFEYKAWMGEYKDGRPWNGCFPGQGGLVCLVDGIEVSEEEYRQLNGYPEDAMLAPGCGYFDP